MFKFLKSKETMPSPINYLFYFCAFLYVSVLSTILIFSREGSVALKSFYLLYSLAQTFLEISLLALIGTWIRQKAHILAYRAYIGLSFVFFLGYFIHFIMVRLMDVSISYMFKLLFGEGFAHFIAAFTALNMNSWMIILGTSLLFLIPLIGIAFYEITRKLAQKKPTRVSAKKLLRIVCVLALTLFSLDIGTRPLLNSKNHAGFERTLPLGQTFLPPSTPSVSLQNPLKEARSEEEVQKSLASKQFTAEKKPNIYLFVVETFRKDHITDAITPSLASFQKEYFSLPLSLANANGTHISWFSIFHSNFPHHWSQVKNSWKKGSVPLQILKKLGYKINVFSSAELSYFQMDETLFGKNKALVDEFQDFKSESSASGRDKMALSELNKALEKEDGKEGNLFVIFLDSTHSEYSWSEDFKPKFTPYVDKIDYLGMASSKKDLELVKNRYKNSVSYIDHLFGSFLQTLKDKNLFDESVIALTGDHGEEFFEKGALFHGSHLNDLQTEVPILFKFGMEKNSSMKASNVSQMDIFPSILQHITKESSFASLFDGESIFEAKKHPYILTVQQNGGQKPVEFSLNDGSHKLLAKISSDSSSMEVLDFQDTNNNSTSPDPLLLKSAFDCLK
jgi:glucan phosphoethanolaminetransferase (alkaline phosphatase superfamily)